jgi:nondiscriminating aspartyl-tRNA synthetase
VAPRLYRPRILSWDFFYNEFIIEKGVSLMKRELAKNLKNCIGETVMLQGSIHKIRKLGKIAFIILRDRSGLVQCILDTKTIDIKGLKTESIIEVVGAVNNKYDNNEEVEILVETLKVIVLLKDDIPIEINKEELEVNIDTLLNNRVLSLRNIKNNLIFRVEAVLVQGFSEFLIKEDFTQVFTPKIVAAGTEGGTELFEVKYFEKKAYLAQSPQFYKQMLVGSGFERVYEIGHVYRAEEHNTLRHLNEYVSLDLEMGFIEDERDLMELETRLIKYMLSMVKKKFGKELIMFSIDIPEIKEAIPCLKLQEAIEILKINYGKYELENDLDPEGEKLISQYIKETTGSEFVFLTHYPKIKRPMYVMPAEETLTHSFDLLFRGIEITTGGQRINDYDMLVRSIVERGLSADSFQEYLTVFKFGIPPHGGLAIGLERLTSQLLGYRNVREATLFPRDRDRITP